MNLLSLPMAALAWLGRQGTRALAVSIFLGLAVAPLAAYVKPYLGASVFVLLLLSYLRTDPAAFVRIVRAPRLALVGTLWIMVALPLLFGTAYWLSGIRDTVPALYMILILQCIMAPITSSVAFAAMLGLDVALALVTLIASSALTPITTVGLSYLFLGTSLISPLELGGKLFLLFAISGALALVLRRIFGQSRIEAHKESIDGMTVIATFVFAIAAMNGVTDHVIAAPLLSLGIFGLSIAVSAAFIVLTVLVFIRAGLDRALVIGLLAGFRNVGVLMAALGPSVPELAWFYFAVSQFPIYLLPMLLKPLARRFQQRR